MKASSSLYEMEKMNNMLAAFVLVVAISGAYGTQDECVPEGDLYCSFPRIGGFTFAPVYYLLPDGTKCNVGCSLPINPTDGSCPNVPVARRSIPDLFRRQFLLPKECRQMYFLYVNVGDRICGLGDTYNAACVIAAENN